MSDRYEMGDTETPIPIGESVRVRPVQRPNVDQSVFDHDFVN